MPNKKWSNLNRLQLGRYAEYYAKMELASYGLDVYTSEVDDHGIDFVCKDVNVGTFYEIQVKSIYKSDYVYILKNKLVMDDRHWVCFIHFIENELPKVYMIPATAWKNPTKVLVDRNYDKPGQKSKPEWGISYSKSKYGLLDDYTVEKFVLQIRGTGGALR